MSAHVRRLTNDAASNDNAGLASHFAELAHRKVRQGGAVSLVLPLSALSGGILAQCSGAVARRLQSKRWW